ncbi:hypothetical protein VE03_02079 [Pseudogymnoascus sp. 23342-1-I1]|nr:hypothetical protein VE03_02079 [Pseudogymnoascus sp. 23342-1-I1]
MGCCLSALLGRLVGCTGHKQQHTHAYAELKDPLPPHLHPFNKKSPLIITTSIPPPTDYQLADRFSGLLLFSRTSSSFRHGLSVSFPPPPQPGTDFSTETWTPNLAVEILNSITAAIEAGVSLGAANEVVEMARRDVKGWVGEHPGMAEVAAVIVAMGILVVIAPWVVEGLGFGGLGVRLGSFAARWQSTYGGATPGGSLFSFLQRMGML